MALLLLQMRYECTQETCPCGAECSNRRLQVGSTVATAVVDCGRKGVGAIVLEDVDIGRFIDEYVGEVSTSVEVVMRCQVHACCC